MDFNRTTMEAITTGFRKNFNDAFAGVKPIWERVATEVPSTTSKNTYPWLGDMPGLREWIGDRIIKDFSGHDYTIINREFEMTVGVKKPAIEDDEFGVFSTMFKALGEAAAKWPDELVWDTVRKGFVTECYDGQNFFDTDHPVYNANGEASGVVSNMQAGTDAPWVLMNSKGVLKPFIFQTRKKPNKLVALDKDTDVNVFMRNQFIYGSDGRGNAGYGFWQMAFGSKAVLNEANLKAARLAMRSITDGRGRPLVNEPDLLVVSTANADAAEELLMKQRKANGEDNVLAGKLDLLVSPYLF